VPAPFVLVGHSLGGLYARHFAQLFPKEVTGLVLLDPAHEDYDSFMPEELNELRKVPKGKPVAFTKSYFERLFKLILTNALKRPFTRSLLLRVPALDHYRKLYRSLFAQEMALWPEEIRKVLIENHVSPEWLFAGNDESRNLYQLYDEVHLLGSMLEAPMIIICSMAVDEFRRAVSVGEPDALLQEEIKCKWQLYSTITASVPHGECRPVEAGHFNMHFRHPDLVLRAIQDILSK